VFYWQENGYRTRGSIRAEFCLPNASISVHFPALKLRISEEKRWIGIISKTCAGIRIFLQPVPETDRPDGQTGLVMSQDRLLGDEAGEGGSDRNCWNISDREWGYRSQYAPAGYF
jgi:hypothetical protein